MLALLLGCGEASELSTPSSSRPAADISGNLVETGAAESSVLVFAFGDMPADSDLAQHQPTYVGSVGTNGEFILSSPPGGVLTVVFLADAANDGAIDPGDSVAVLTDEAQQLYDLQEGDQVNLVDVHLDFTTRQARADRIDMVRALTPVPTRTPAT